MFIGNRNLTNMFKYFDSNSFNRIVRTTYLKKFNSILVLSKHYMIKLKTRLQIGIYV